MSRVRSERGRFIWPSATSSVVVDSGHAIYRPNQRDCAGVSAMAGDQLPDDTDAPKAALIEARAKLSGAQALITCNW
jgi:hypothetical protein